MHLIIYSCNRLFAETLSTCICARVSKWDVVLCATINDLENKIQQPSIALIDLSSKNVLNYIKDVSSTCENTSFVALAVAEIDIEVLACIDAGFTAYVPKDSSVEKLLHVLDLAQKGEFECDPKIASALVNEVKRRKNNQSNPSKELSSFSSNIKSLTPREREVVFLLNKGLSNKEIARNLEVSVSTIKNHLNRVFSKFEVTRRAEMIAALNENLNVASYPDSQLSAYSSPHTKASLLSSVI